LFVYLYIDWIIYIASAVSMRGQ